MIRHAFAKALRQIRKTRGLRQEDFSDHSSRTYLSVLERGQKNPTLEKIAELALVLRVHMLTLLALTTLKMDKGLDADSLLRRIRKELDEVTREEK